MYAIMSAFHNAQCTKCMLTLKMINTCVQYFAQKQQNYFGPIVKGRTNLDVNGGTQVALHEQCLV